jgi:hypothetical protein
VAGTIGAAMTAATLPTGTTAVGGPLLGATGRVYLGAAYTDSGRTTTEGRVYLTDASLASLSTPWALKSLPLTRPPALDCARPLFAGPKVAQLGTLYIVSGPTLVALSVDDWGLDANAPWPQDGHDPNWTFSADGPVKCLE